jgi:hypothetical protein
MPGGKKWIIFSVVALVAALVIMLGSYVLFQNSRENAEPFKPAQITARIISEMNRTDLAEVSGSQLSKHYDIPDGVIIDSSLYMSRSSDSASELACFYLVDKSQFAQLQTAVTAHLNSKAAGFKSLNPAQYNALKNASVTQKGKYVLVSVGSNPAADAKLFNEILKAYP